MYNGYTHKKLKDIWRKLFPSTKTWSQQFKLSEWHHRARRVSRWLKEMEETRKPKVFGDEFHLGEREESRLRPKRLAWEHRWTPCKQWAEKGLRGQSSEKKKKKGHCFGCLPNLASSFWSLEPETRKWHHHHGVVCGFSSQVGRLPGSPKAPRSRFYFFVFNASPSFPHWTKCN